MLTSLVYLLQGNFTKSKKMMKMVNTEEENLHIFQTTWRISMKFSGKVCLMIILKVTKNQGFTVSRKYDFKILRSIWHPSLFRVISLKPLLLLNLNCQSSGTISRQSKNLATVSMNEIFPCLAFYAQKLKFLLRKSKKR